MIDRRTERPTHQPTTHPPNNAHICCDVTRTTNKTNTNTQHVGTMAATGRQRFLLFTNCAHSRARYHVCTTTRDTHARTHERTHAHGRNNVQPNDAPITTGAGSCGGCFRRGASLPSAQQHTIINEFIHQKQATGINAVGCLNVVTVGRRKRRADQNSSDAQNQHTFILTCKLVGQLREYYDTTRTRLRLHRSACAHSTQFFRTHTCM